MCKLALAIAAVGALVTGCAFRKDRGDKDELGLPLGPDEVQVVVRLEKFVEWGEVADGGKWSPPGFILRIVAPEKYKGRLVTAHHDGLLASGDPMKLVAPGKLYYLRTSKELIGDMSMGTCSVQLRLREVGATRP